MYPLLLADDKPESERRDPEDRLEEDVEAVETELSSWGNAPSAGLKDSGGEASRSKEVMSMGTVEEVESDVLSIIVCRGSCSCSPVWSLIGCSESGSSRFWGICNGCSSRRYRPVSSIISLRLRRVYTKSKGRVWRNAPSQSWSAVTVVGSKGFRDSGRTINQK